MPGSMLARCMPATRGGCALSVRRYAPYDGREFGGKNTMEKKKKKDPSEMTPAEKRAQLEKKKAKNIRDIIRNADLKVVSDVPEAFWKLTKMLQKFLSGMHFQEVKAGASIVKVFGRYDTCPFQPHSNWHRFSSG